MCKKNLQRNKGTFPYLEENAKISYKLSVYQATPSI